MIQTEEFTVLFRLILAHLLTDFIFQPSAWVNERRLKKHRSVKLYLHALITAFTAYLFAGLWLNWWLPLLIFITHLLIDIWKSHKGGKLRYFIADQFLHFLVIVLLWLLVFNRWNAMLSFITDMAGSNHIIIVISAYTLVAWPLGLLIGIATERWRKEADISREGLARAGMWIGLLERFLILSFILIEQYTAIGFLIAAKSILRFSDKENTQKKTEYVLIGTLMSFSLSFVTGLIVKFLLTAT